MKEWEWKASAYVMPSERTRGGGTGHAVSGSGRQRRPSCCQREWEAASYIVPSRRTRDGGITSCRGWERETAPYVMPSVYEACTVNNDVRCFVRRTLRRGWAPKCYKILYTFLLSIFFFFDHLHCSKILHFLLLNQRYKSWGKINFIGSIFLLQRLSVWVYH